jgi:acetyltransferase, GNAT family
MEIITYREEYKQQIINLILHIQNDEAGIALSLDEQPDLKNIPEYYQKNGGQFFIAIEGRELIGTIAIMNYGNNNAVLKKFFVRSDFRGKGIGRALYCELLEYARDMGFERIVLDTPAVAQASHRFYEKSGFERIKKSELPFKYEYPDRDSYLYLLNL